MPKLAKTKGDGAVLAVLLIVRIPVVKGVMRRGRR